MDNLDMMSDFESVYPTVDDYFNFKKRKIVIIIKNKNNSAW